MESSPPDMEAYRRLTRQFQYGRPSQIPSQRHSQSQLQSQRPNYPWSKFNSQRSQSSNFQTVPSQSQIHSQYSSKSSQVARKDSLDDTCESQRYPNQSQSLFARESQFRPSQPQKPKTPEIEKKEIATQTTPRRMARLYQYLYKQQFRGMNRNRRFAPINW